MSSKTLFITGVSSGFGLALSREALSAGHRVIGTVRNEEARRAFEALHEDRAHAVLLDVTDVDAIPVAVADAETRFGPVDVLVNNAGYGHEGIFEESPLDEMRRQFEVNVFGAVAVTQAFCRDSASAAAGTSSISPRWAASSRCPGSRTTAAASSHSRA